MVFIFTFIEGLIRDLCVFTNRLFMDTDVELPPCLLSLAHGLGLPQTAAVFAQGTVSCSANKLLPHRFGPFFPLSLPFVHAMQEYCIFARALLI